MQAAVPGNIQHVPAHDPVKRSRIEGRAQLRHIGFMVAGSVEKIPEPANGHVRESKEIVKGYSIFVIEDFLIAFFQGLLRRRQKGAGGIMDKMQQEAATRPAETLPIQNAQRLEKVEARLARRVPGSVGRRQFLTVRIEGDEAIPVFKESGAITSTANADGYIEIAENIDLLEKGEPVTVTLF